MSQLVCVRSYGTRFEAESAKSLLAEQNIDAIVQVDDCGGMRPYLAFTTGGAKLIIKAEDAEEVEQVLVGHRRSEG